MFTGIACTAAIMRGRLDRLDIASRYLVFALGQFEPIASRVSSARHTPWRVVHPVGLAARHRGVAGHKFWLGGEGQASLPG